LPSRHCACCRRKLSSDRYSKHQWSKGVSASICYGCLDQDKKDCKVLIDPGQTARRNNSKNAIFTEYALSNPFASGSFRWVAKGKYTTGDRVGQVCVCKWFKKSRTKEEAQYFETDIATSKEAIRLITIWNSKRLIDRIVKINLPEVWTCASSSDSLWIGRKVLQEPFIEDYQKFNSNNGWADSKFPWGRVMQAISHFTYHVSKGKKLLCDLQGGVYKDGVILTDPVVMAAGDGARYGPTDLGSEGISSFFAKHKCNEYCQSSWQKPHDQTPYYTLTAGTTMMTMTPTKHIPTHKSRKPMTRAHH
jgi:Alpha-kinase family